MKNIHTQESGRSMIEMLGVLAIIGVLSVGGIAGYSQAMNKFKVSKTTDQIQTLVTNIRTLTASQKNYALVDNAGILQKMGALTDEMCSDTTCTTANMVNPYGGSIKMATYGTGNKHFYISYQGLPASACVSLATQAWGDSSSGLEGVMATSTAPGTPGTAPGATSSVADGTAKMVTPDSGEPVGGNPMSYASASQGCGSASTSAVTFYYR